MALYIPSLQTVFVHVYRCGGTSIRHAIMQKYGHETFDVGLVHDPADVVYGLAGIFKRRIKYGFAIVRNPHEWVVSQYYFIREKANNHPMYHEVSELSFKDFCQWYEHAVYHNRMWLGGRFMTQRDFIYGKNQLGIYGKVVDDVFALEKSRDWWPMLAKKLDLPIETLRTINKTDLEEPVSNMYDIDSYRLIQKVLEPDHFWHFL